MIRAYSFKQSFEIEQHGLQVVKLNEEQLNHFIPLLFIGDLSQLGGMIA